MADMIRFDIANIGDRKHPQYDEKRMIWDFLLASCKGGMGMKGRSGMTTVQAKNVSVSGFFPGLFPFKREDVLDYITRTMLTPYTPFARQIVEEFANFITKDEPTRDGADSFGDILQNADLKKHTMTEFINAVMTVGMMLGDLSVLIDLPRVETPLISRRQEIDSGVRPYCVILTPQSIVDWSMARDGRYDWLIYSASYWNNSVTNESAVLVNQRVYWDSERWAIYEEHGDKKAWIQIAGGLHPCGEVPVVRLAARDTDSNILTPESWFYDLADINRAIYNLDSLDLMNLHYQTHNVMIVPSDGDDGAHISMSATHALAESAQDHGVTRFIAPSGATSESFAAKIDNLKERMYLIAGLQRRAQSSQPEAGIAKEWDFQRVNQFLAEQAAAAERLENEIVRMVELWNGQREASYSAQYKRNFAVEELADIVEGVLGLKQLGFSSEIGRKEATKKLYREVLSNIPPERLIEIEKEVDASVEADPLAGFDTNREEDEPVKN